MPKTIDCLKKRQGWIRYIIYGPKSEALYPAEGDVAWVEDEKGNCFGIRIDAILSDGNLTGTVVQLRPSVLQEVNGICRKDKVFFCMDFIWKVVRPG